MFALQFLLLTNLACNLIAFNRYNLLRRPDLALSYEVRKFKEAPWDERPLRNLHTHNSSYPYNHNQVFESRMVNVRVQSLKPAMCHKFE